MFQTVWKKVKEVCARVWSWMVKTVRDDYEAAQKK